MDNLEIAQFIHVLLNNQRIRDAIDTITSKAVLILGRFTPERKAILEAMRAELRQRDYLPIIFDFDPSPNRTTIETIKTLASMAKFVVANLTDAKSVLQELQAVVPTLPSVSVQLIIKRTEHEYGILDYIRSYQSVVSKTYEYETVEEVISSIQENIIAPVEAKLRQLRNKE